MTIVHEPVQPALAYLPTPAVRRRKVILGLVAADAAAGLATAGTGAPLAWAALVVLVALTVTYMALLHRSRRRQAELDFGLRRAADESSFLAELAELRILPESITAADPLLALDAAARAGVPAWRRALALTRFVAAYAAGWALAPLVFALTIAVGKTPRDTTGQRWLANLQATRTRLEEQSIRTLMISAAATASVTGVAGVAATAGGASAFAAPAPAASAGVGAPAAAGVGLPALSSSTYQVVSGDTLSAVAARFGTTWQALASANHLADPNVIYPGQVLIVSGGSGATAAPSSSYPSGSAASTYTVQPGDTLGAIAARFGTTYQELASINGIADPNVIEVGQVLRLSGGGAVSTAAATFSSSGTVASDPAPAPLATSSRAQTAVRTALAQVGKPYEWAGAGPNAFDCSGLVMYAWASAGVSLAHYTVSQYQETSRISQGQLQPGDLVFYDTGDGAQPGHVTMYIGNGQVVTADSPGTVIRVENLDWDGVPMGFGRVA